MILGRSIVSKSLLAGFISTGFAVRVWAGAEAQNPPTTQDPQQTAEEIRQLKARLEQLETQVNSSKAPAAQAGGDSSAAEAVLRDAEQRSKLLDLQGFTAGYDNRRFVIRSEDGNFVFKPWLHLQFREVLNWRQDAVAGGT